MFVIVGETFLIEFLNFVVSQYGSRVDQATAFALYYTIVHSVGKPASGKYAGINFFDIEVFGVKNCVIIFFTNGTILSDHWDIVYYSKMSEKQKEQLGVKLRLKILQLASKVPSPHPHIGSCMSCIDILIQTLVFEMNPQDKFILSKGHASLALYVVLNYLKKISDRELETYFAEGTYFGIHTPSHMKTEIPLATGSLGHGLSFAAGLAKGFKLRRNKIDSRKRVFCLMSDGECNEGAVWEAALFASQHKLDNLIVMIDKNKLQAFGRTNDVLGDGASAAKWRAFGFEVVNCDGHDLVDLAKVFNRLKKVKNHKPRMIICKTVRGKGIKAIEDKVESNYTTMVREIYRQAVKDIKRL